MDDALSLLRFYESAGYVKSGHVKKAFLKVDRRMFVPPELKDYAYLDRPLPISSNATISAPHMHLIYLEELELRKGQKVLEIGFGSGILLAYLVEIVGPGNVFGVEVDPIVYSFGVENLKRSGYYDKVKVFLMDGKKGLSKYAPYDRIAVSATSGKIYSTWLKQLKDGGIILLPLREDKDQWLCKLIKKEGKVKKKKLMLVSFVGLQ